MLCFQIVIPEPSPLNGTVVPLTNTLITQTESKLG